jgi:hypothetical protein
MTGVPSVSATVLHQRLVENGIVVLAVTADRDETGWFTVYLHGPAGNYQQETAFALLAAAAGVREVRVSDQTRFILRVCQLPDVRV